MFLNTNYFSILLLSLGFSIFIPDLLLILKERYDKRVNEKLEVDDKNKENPNWNFLPQHLGRIERVFFWIVLFFWSKDFVAFLGIWLVLKVVGGYGGWQEVGTDPFKRHRGRAKFMIFVILTSSSIFSVIFIVCATKLLLNFLCM